MASQSDHNTGLRAWQERVAKAFAKQATAQTIGQDRLSRDLSTMNIDGKITAENSVVSVAVTVSPDAGLPAGMNRGQLTPEALAEFDAEALRASQEQTWKLIKSRQTGGYIDADTASALLDELGFVARPEDETRVEGYITTDARDRYGDRVSEHISFTLPGNVGRDEVIAKLATVYTDQASLLGAAFPEAKNLPKAFSNIDVTVRSTWPEKCEYAKASA